MQKGNEILQGKTSLLNTKFSNMDKAELLYAVIEHAKRRERANLIFVNVDVIMKMEKDDYLRQISEEAEYVLADVMPIVWISKLKGRTLKEKVSGSDFLPLLCEQAAKEHLRLFFVGGREGVAAKAAMRLADKYKGLEITGTYAPPFGFEKNPDEIAKMNQIIRESNSDILVVCLGCPKQEKYVYENQEKYQIPVSVCAGAAIDFLAGNIKRCPSWMSRYGLEWFYRFLQEPGRLFKRYFIDDMQIIRLIFKYRD